MNVTTFAVGTEFGVATVIKIKDKVVLFKCECGVIFERTIKSLSSNRGGYVRRGPLGICGKCIPPEDYRKIKHVYFNMMKRCHNSKDRDFYCYGNRGIIVCKRYRDNMYLFISDCYKKYGYKQGLELDRIHNDFGYYPKNIRFVSHKVNSNNKRTTSFIEYQGEALSIEDFVQHTNLPRYIIYDRISEGWTSERIASTPIQHKRKREL